jgi:hypothetical protein
MRHRFALYLAFMSLAHGIVRAQQTLYEDGRSIYRQEWYGGIVAHGDGWGVHLFRGKFRTAFDRSLLGLEIVGMKHPKEVKSFNPVVQDARGYFYGKSNAALFFRPTVGGKRQITDKIRRNGVEISYVWGVGPSFAMLKPVYLQIGEPAFIYEVVTTQRYDPGTHGVDDIIGRASWFTGVGESRFYPGAFTRFGFNFEYAGENEGVKALEVGATLDAFAKTLPIMAELEGVKNKQFFLEFYVALQFGKKLER